MLSSVQSVNYGNCVRICMVCGLESLAARVRAGPPVPTDVNFPTLSDL